MTVSNITATALQAVNEFGHVRLNWFVTDPNSFSGSTALQLDQVEIWASTTNDVNTASKVVEGRNAAVHAAVLEGATYYYWARARDLSANEGTYWPAGGGVPCLVQYANSAAQDIRNISLAISAPSGALKCAIKTLSGDDPSPTNPIVTSFRTTAGGVSYRQLNSALSMTLNNGSTLETNISTSFRIWWILFENAGTPVLGAIKCADVNRWNIFPINEGVPALTTAEASSANTAGVFYTASAIATASAFRILGYTEFPTGQTFTAGAWTIPADARTVVRYDGMKLPGEVVQSRYAQMANTILSNTTTIPLGTAAPTTSQGSGITLLDLAFTPNSRANYIDFRAEMQVSHHVGSCHLVAALFVDTETSAEVSSLVKISAVDDINRLILTQRYYPDFLFTQFATDAHTFKLRFGGSAAGLWTVGGYNGGGTALFGNALVSFSKIEELMT